MTDLNRDSFVKSHSRVNRDDLQMFYVLTPLSLSLTDAKVQHNLVSVGVTRLHITLTDTV